MSFSCIIVDEEKFLPEYVLAILNSKIAREWFYTFGKKRGAGVDIGVQKIRTFPIKECERKKQVDISSKVRMLMEDYEAHKNLDVEIDKEISELYGG